MPETPRRALTRCLAGGYLLLLAYGSLFPLSNWRPPGMSVTAILMRLPTNPPSSDMATNLLVYVPAGFLLMLALPGSRVPRAAIAVAICALLSFTLECLQAWLPARDTSGLDLTLNATGALIGTLAAPVSTAALRLSLSLPGYVSPLRDERVTRAGLMALALWFGSHWAPFVPSLDPWHAWQAVKPLWITIRNGGFDPYIALAYGLETFAVGVLLAGLLRNPYPAALWLVGLVLMLLAGKVLMVGRSLSAESLLGLAAGTVLVSVPPGPFTRRRAVLGAAALLASWAMISLAGPSSDTPQQSFNWIPLRGHLSNPIAGIMDLFDTSWPGAVLAYLALRGDVPRQRGALAAGALAIVAYTGALEWLQRWQTESYPDVTDMLIPSATWVITFIAGARSRRPTARPGKAP